MDAKADDLRTPFRESSGDLELLLWAVWNPTGNVPLDEYSGYVAQIWRLLHEHANPSAVAAALERIAREQMGVDGADHVGAAERLTAWWYWRFDYPAERPFADERSTGDADEFGDD